MITIQNLQTASKIIKIAVLARLAGIASATLDSKVRFNRELTVTESVALEKVLKENGILLQLPE